MSQLIYKAAYSRPIQYKRILMNQHKLNEFLGRNLLAEKDGDIEEDEFSLSNESFLNKAQNKRVTYAELLDRIKAAEGNYDTARAQQMTGNKINRQQSDDVRSQSTQNFNRARSGIGSISQNFM